MLRYGPGDYAGPHNDHHPENKDARAGYIDLHVSLCAPGVAHQWLVYSRAGHFSEIVSVAQPATVTAYRLPFWHYTTPLVTKRGKDAARWVLLGTFLYRLRQPSPRSPFGGHATVPAPSPANIFISPTKARPTAQARNALLEEEMELRRQVERVAPQRRALPQGGEVTEDYVFEGSASGSRRRKALGAVRAG